MRGGKELGCNPFQTADHAPLGELAQVLLTGSAQPSLSPSHFINNPDPDPRQDGER